jgi:exosortase D (VPLPA-CTERM-specific)
MQKEQVMSPTGISVPVLVIGLVIAVALAMFAAWDGVLDMVTKWEREEYSYGYFVPLLILFFIWQRKNEIAKVELSPSWIGVLLAVIGLVTIAAGQLATIFTIVQYGFVITLHGIAYAFLGWKGYRIVMIPLALMFFAVPLPGFFYNNLSNALQLISSEIGVWVIRQFGISVYLEGNVIQLAQMKLQVVEACSGLRYLFPLTAVSFMIAYIYRAPMWKRVIVFLSAIPITVLMNSVRIGLVGVTVEHWGPAMAEGILHDFEGWVIFMSSLGLILIEMLILNQIGRPKQRFNDTFYIELPGPLPEGVEFKGPSLSSPMIAVVALLVAAAGFHHLAPSRDEIIPERPDFATFPGKVENWTGKVDRLDQIFLDALKLDDYLLADYTAAEGKAVNVYSAYYGSQRSGAAVHSPRTCLPGDGWVLDQFGQRRLDGIAVNGQPLQVNRSIIKKGDAAQLVYYWFQQRGRIITNEYLVKWYLFRDSVMMRRTDGALVRLTTLIWPDESVDDADARLTDLAGKLAPHLETYIPN